jgi:hypothetical protein
MTFFPQNPAKRLAASSTAASTAGRPVISRDILWNQPVFKAPGLPNPRIAFDPLPFTSARITRRSAKA